jgi:formylglycine-generating enzyme required for sulfatase activity
VRTWELKAAENYTARAVRYVYVARWTEVTTMVDRIASQRTVAAVVVVIMLAGLWLAQVYSRAADRPLAATLPTGLAPSSRPVTTTVGKAFKVTVPGGAAEIEMLPVPAGVLDLVAADGRVEHKQVKAFYMAKTELTWDDWDPWYMFLDLPANQRRNFPIADAQSRPSRQYSPMDHGWGHDGFPVLNQHFNAPQMYCRWLSEKAGRKFRLPTEAEWEYAARAGGAARHLTVAELERVAWFDKNSGEQTHPVAKLAPNAWGFYDMLGNVGEWVLTTDGTGVVAGGAFTDGEADVQVTARARFDKSWDKSDDMDPPSRWWLYDAPFAGFRIVCDP